MTDAEHPNTSPTGGSKNSKPARPSMIPPAALLELAEHYGKGAAKYAPGPNGRDNWRNGYSWALSYDACQRHLLQFWSGEDIDPDTGSKHVIAAAWHCLALATWIDEHPEYDDRDSTLVKRDKWEWEQALANTKVAVPIYMDDILAATDDEFIDKPITFYAGRTGGDDYSGTEWEDGGLIDRIFNPSHVAYDADLAKDFEKWYKSYQYMISMPPPEEEEEDGTQEEASDQANDLVDHQDHLVVPTGKVYPTLGDLLESFKNHEGEKITHVGVWDASTGGTFKNIHWGGAEVPAPEHDAVCGGWYCTDPSCGDE